MKSYLLPLLLLALIFQYQVTGAQPQFTALTRQSFYSGERDSEILLRISANNGIQFTKAVVSHKSLIISEKSVRPGETITRIPFSLEGKNNGDSLITELISSSGKSYRKSCAVTVLKRKANEVKTDRLTGALITNGLPFFPVGFYCYSPVSETLPAEEIVNGFTVISPYQKIIPETADERKRYMDNCARIGMKVHYNLLSVSGGGGVNSKIAGLSDEEKRARLKEEIKRFMDHPALLAWYISD